MTGHTDPLCLFRDEPVTGFPHICPCCLVLRTARLQGPVKTNGHVVGCWCPTCYPHGYDTTGRPE